jgi:hypothetical protein
VVEPGQHGDGRQAFGAGQSSSISRASRSTPTPVSPSSTGRGTRSRGDAAGQALLELAVVDRLAAEVALHEVVVADHDAFDQLLVHGVLLVDQLVGDGALVAGRGDGAVDGDCGAGVS